MTKKLTVGLCVTLAVAFAASQVLARAAKSNVGQTLPPLKLKMLQGNANFTGKPLIVEFWATWCPPCRKSIPHLNEVYAKYKAKGLEIVGVTNEESDTVRAFMKTMPMNYNVAHDAGGSLGKKFGVTGIPHALLVNRQGQIVWEGHPLSLSDAEIEKVLK